MKKILQIDIFVIEFSRTNYLARCTQMSTDTATGPAWQVRESARQKLLEGIQQKIIGREDDFVTYNFNLYGELFSLLERKLTLLKNGIDGDGGAPVSIWEDGKKVHNLFSEIVTEVVEFQRSKEEGNALLAKLLEWVAGEIARPFYSTLQTQEFHHPKLIYGIEDRTKEVPFE